MFGKEKKDKNKGEMPLAIMRPLQNRVLSKTENNSKLVLVMMSKLIICEASYTEQ